MSDSDAPKLREQRDRVLAFLAQAETDEWLSPEAGAMAECIREIYSN